MGVLNVTPDSFSDGGCYDSVESAVGRARTMIDQGAAIVDIGGESTRPGSASISIEAELARVIPVIEALRAESNIFISVDTSHPEVIRAAGVAGADMINDIRGLGRPGAVEAAVAVGTSVCIMHMQGEPATMQDAPFYHDVVAEIREYLADRVAACRAAGLPAGRIAVDPGVGFGKTLEHNLTLLRAIGALDVAGCPVLMGVSRKSMFAHLFGHDDMGSRINGSLGAAFWAVLEGVGIIRSHDVRETVQMVRLARGLMES